MLTSDMNMKEYALVCHHLHSTRSKIPTSFNDTHEAIELDDFTCAVKEGEVVSVRGYRDAFQLITGLKPLDRKGY